MKLRLTVLLLALWPAVALAQGEPKANPQTQMYEDVEVMRRLLVGKLHAKPGVTGLTAQCASCHVVQGGLERLLLDDGPGKHPLMRDTPHNFFDSHTHDALLNHTGLFYADPHSPILKGVALEGVYLKGTGVVYSLTLPSSGPDPRPGGGKPADKSPSDWERMRQQVRGEKKDGATPTAADTLGDLILRVLADNGKHLSQLGDNEGVTVAVTFREAESLKALGTTIERGGGTPEGSLSPPSGGPQPPGGGRLPGDGGGGSGLGSSSGGGPLQPPTTARDYELLGDLHFRQANMKGAVEAYEQAVKRTTKSKELAALYQKLAAAHLAPGQADGEKAIQKGLEWLQRAQAESGKASKSSEAPAASALPAKLVITASKKLLDQVGSGKVSFDEFRKQATIDYLSFSPPEKPPGK